MALSKEEISIRLGVNSQGVTKGMVQMNNFIDHSLGEVQKKFLKFSTGLAAGFVVGAISDGVQFIIQKWQDGWDHAFKEMTNAWYGFTEDAMRDADRISEYWSRARTAQKGAQKAKDKAGDVQRDSDFKKGDDSVKLGILDMENKAAEEAYQIAKREYDITRQLVREHEKRLNAEQKYYEALAARIKAADALESQLTQSQKDAAASNSSSAAVFDHYKRESDAIAQRVRNLRRDLKILKDEPGTQLEQEKIKEKILAEIENRKTLMSQTGMSDELPSSPVRKVGIDAIKDYMAKIKESSDAYKAKTDYSQFGKAIVDAQVEAAAEFVQNVAIVEIKEKGRNRGD
jgi:hypothetical protein